MAEHIEKCSDCGAEFEVLHEPEVPFAPGGRPYYCAECFVKYHDVKDVPYITKFVVFLSEKLVSFMQGKIDAVKTKGFLYNLVLIEKGAKEPKFICTIELKHAGIADPISKFIVIFSTKRSEIQNIDAFIDEFRRKYGSEAEAQIISRRR